MKKLTLAIAVLMFAGTVFAQDGGKSCCKKSGKCSKECCKKDTKKCDSKESASTKSTDKKSTTR